MKHLGWAVSALLCLTTSIKARANVDLEDWIGKQETKSIELMLKNISPEGAAKGAVVASPSKDNPNYFFHWIRDAALIMDIVVELYLRASTPADKARFHTILVDFIDFSRRNQLTENPSGHLGEPKFMADGSAFTGPWGRPQNDGPALRAIALTKLAFQWLTEGKEALVREKLYRPELPANSVIKADLEFVSHRWKDSNFDLWEEIRGQHFYTRMVQRRSLIDGARLARLLGDPKAALWYEAQAKALEAKIAGHWDPSKKILVATVERDGGVDYKWSGLDTAIVLAVLHGETKDGFFPPTDPQVLATVARLEETFAKLYPINQNGVAGIGIGRYPEDRYDGYTTSGQGNPWVLLTAALAEYYYNVARGLEETGGFVVNDTNRVFYERLDITDGTKFKSALAKLRAKGDEYLARIRYHGPDGHFAEQFNRHSGFMQGARDLTWSYGAFVTALWDRPEK